MKLVLAKNGDVIFFAVPFADKLMIVFEGVFIDRLGHSAFDKAI